MTPSFKFLLSYSIRRQKKKKSKDINQTISGMSIKLDVRNLEKVVLFKT